MEENQKFKIEIDGVVKDAELVDIVTYNNNRYAVYGTDENENEDLYVSLIKTDENGFETLEDVNDVEVKKYVIDLINEAINN